MFEDQRAYTDTTIDQRERSSHLGSSTSTTGGRKPFRLLLVVTTADASRVVELEERATITLGRAAPAELLLSDPSLSRLHARLRREGESVRVMDLGSRNGTWVAGQRVEEAVVPAGGAIAFGATLVSVQLALPPQAATLGLASPGSMLTRIEDECARSCAFGRTLSVLVARPLRKGSMGSSELGERCLRALRPSDRAGLYDRDALIAVLPETDAREALRVAERITSENTDSTQLVCGLASLTSATPTAEQLVSAAWGALHGACAAKPIGIADSGEQVRPSSRDTLIRRSRSMLELERLIERVAARPITVMLLGETGTGKELIARELHERSDRARGPLRVVNCAAIPEHLTESVLFGHVRGAFTGAHRDQAGVFSQAHGGTLFLDEVGELSSDSQAALLRVLDTRRICPIGANTEREVDVRVVAATHRDLSAMAERGTFRLDLYHRLTSIVLRVPPLRERTDEIAPLMEHFLDCLRPAGTLRPRLSEDALARLLSHRWPGNVRELRNVAERALALFEGDCVRASDLPHHVGAHTEPEPVRQTDEIEAPAEPDESRFDASAMSLRTALQQHEVALIQEALRRSSGNQRRAAKLLQLPLRTLERKLRVLRVRASDDD